MDLTKDQLVEMYRRMLRIRRFDETAAELLRRGEIPGVCHTAIGQEATVVGACMALRPDDYMTGTHRSHGHPIGKGSDLKPLMAELFGKQTGVCKGKGGSMHLANFKVGSLGESSIVGSAIPVATGAGLSAKLRGTDQVCLCFFGDGAATQGAFHESLNLAASWKLPVIYLCENNQYAVSTSCAYATSVKDISARAASYDIPGLTVDGQDAIAVYEVVSEAVQRARAGAGPTLIEAKTYRYLEHAEMIGVFMGGYRSEEEIAAWKQRDPIRLLRDRLLTQGVLAEAEAARVEAEVQAEVEEAVAFARQSPYPSPEALFEDLWASPVAPAR